MPRKTRNTKNPRVAAPPLLQPRRRRRRPHHRRPQQMMLDDNVHCQPFQMVLQNKLSVRNVSLSAKKSDKGWKRFTQPIRFHVVKPERHIYNNYL